MFFCCLTILLITINLHGWLWDFFFSLKSEAHMKIMYWALKTKGWSLYVNNVMYMVLKIYPNLMMDRPLVNILLTRESLVLLYVIFITELFYYMEYEWWLFLCLIIHVTFIIRINHDRPFSELELVSQGFNLFFFSSCEFP